MKTKITQADLKARDLLMVRVITGATKAGAHEDRRKAANKKACRGWRGKDGE